MNRKHAAEMKFTKPILGIEELYPNKFNFPPRKTYIPWLTVQILQYSLGHGVQLITGYFPESQPNGPCGI